MKEIKFKVWIPSQKKMGVPFEIHKELTEVPPDDNLYDKFPHESIFLQFTGLSDSCGREIYEGDILMYVSTNQSSMEVKFENGMFVGEGPFNTHPLHDYYTAGDFQSIEIIGNIYEQ